MRLARLAAIRVGSSVVTLLLVSLLVFSAVEVLPGDVASRVLGRDATPAALAAMRAELHLTDPAAVRYLRWLGGVAQGDFGTALSSGRRVTDVVRPRLFNTAILSAFAFVLYWPLALIPAMIQARNRDGPLDHALSIANLALLSMPDFLLATVLLICFVILVPILPAMSTVDARSGVVGYARAIVLPGMTLALVMAAYATRMLRDNLIEVLQSDFVRMAELKGLSRARVVLRHALPNALIPTLNVTALNLGYLIGGVVIVEKVFAYPGFGSLLVDSLQLRDVPLILATVLLASAMYIAANLVADLGAMLLNPRLRA